MAGAYITLGKGVEIGIEEGSSIILRVPIEPKKTMEINLGETTHNNMNSLISYLERLKIFLPEEK